MTVDLEALTEQITMAVTLTDKAAEVGVRLAWNDTESPSDRSEYDRIIGGAQAYRNAAASKLPALIDEVRALRALLAECKPVIRADHATCEDELRRALPQNMRTNEAAAIRADIAKLTDLLNRIDAALAAGVKEGK